MSVTNYSFEDAAASPAPDGRPLGWTVAEASTYIEFAAFSVFAAPPDEGYPRDTFEIGWPDETQAMISALDDDNSTLAIFDVGPAQQLFEDFENNWGVPQNEFELSSLEFAEFDSIEVETFETGFGDYIFELILVEHLDVAVFENTGNETFERGWKLNETSYAALGTTPSFTAASFQSGDTANNYEDFEETVFDQVCIGLPSSDEIEITLPIAHIFTDEDIVYFRLLDDVGSLPSPLEEDTPYFVVNNSYNQLQLEEQIGGGAITITTSGLGSCGIQADFNKYWTDELEL